jgi:hypothetical protein
MWSGARVVAVVVAAAVWGAFAAGGASASSCTRARIGGRSACIAAGQVCKHKYAGQYAKHGLSCTRKGHRGPYRLVRVRPTMTF